MEDIWNAVSELNSKVKYFYGPKSNEYFETLVLGSRSVYYSDEELFTSPKKLEKGSIFHLNCKSPVSLYIDGIVNTTIMIYGKINHLFIRDAEDCSLKLDSTPISGIDMLFSRNFDLHVNHHTWTNIEFGNEIYLGGNLNHTSLFSIYGSSKVYLNGETIASTYNGRIFLTDQGDSIYMGN